MKRIILIGLLLLYVLPLSAQWTNLGLGVQPQVRAAIEELRIKSSLPMIAGTWYFVDRKDGATTGSGRSMTSAMKYLDQAYNRCISGRGDGIVIVSRSVSGSAYGVSIEQDTVLVWAKYGITVVGIASPNAYFGRARIVGKDTLHTLITLTGQNNTFINLTFYNSPLNDNACVANNIYLPAVKVAGARNTFINCHFNTTPDAASAYKTDIEINGGNENRFVDCMFGSSSFNAGDNAAAWIVLSGAGAQNFFENCTFLQQVSAGTAFGAVKSTVNTSLNGLMIMRNCIFGVWRANTHADILASWFIGTKPNTGNIILAHCVTGGFTALDAEGTNDVVWTNQPASHATGGITVAP
ncbi:MAG TPA: hypothetical protein ENN69_01565 [Spirochaetia bacterium]|nr:hypothetical protein [Spirochaetia bacterium]